VGQMRSLSRGLWGGAFKDLTLRSLTGSHNGYISWNMLYF